MSVRETFKDVEISGRKFRIRKFDAQTGSYIAFKLTTQVLPFGMDAQMGGIVGLLSNRKPMSKEEFFELQNDCLKVCSELIEKDGAQATLAVMMADGSWGVDGLESDAMTVIMLTIHSLMFNVTSFFGEDALKGLTEKLQGLSLFNAKE
jgi:hypothetical protein